MKQCQVVLMVAGLCLLASNTFAFDPLFDVRIDYVVDRHPRSVCAADLDGDGDSDLAVANYGSHTVNPIFNCFLFQGGPR